MWLFTYGQNISNQTVFVDHRFTFNEKYLNISDNDNIYISDITKIKKVNHKNKYIILTCLIIDGEGKFEQN